MVVRFVRHAFRRLVFFRNPGQSLLKRFWEDFLNEAISHHLNFYKAMCMGVWRLVGSLFVNGKDLGAQLVRQVSVMAWDGFVGRCDDLHYSELEQIVKDAGLGLWSASPPLEHPWDEEAAAGGGEP